MIPSSVTARAHTCAAGIATTELRLTERTGGFVYQSPVAGISAFISPGRSLDRALDRVALADRLGYDAAYTTHIAGRDSLTTLMAYAGVTERIRLGTGVVPIFSRTPATMAQTAATIDEHSGGRMVLGLGVSHRVTVENWHGATIDKPVTQMREYVAARASDPPRRGSRRTPSAFPRSSRSWATQRAPTCRSTSRLSRRT